MGAGAGAGLALSHLKYLSFLSAFLCTIPFPSCSERERKKQRQFSRADSIRFGLIRRFVALLMDALHAQSGYDIPEAVTSSRVPVAEE